MTKVVADQEARDKIKSRLEKNFLVEAGAGSGKTTSLVERMVNLIYTGTAQIQEMVAITFTRKAADELKVRFQAKLEDAWKDEHDLDRKFLLGEALQNMERCFLGTVHAFCAKLLSERPIEAKLDLEFKELEEADDDDVLEVAWQLYLQNLMETAPEQLELLDELGLSTDQLFPWLKRLSEYPDVEWVASETAKPELHDAYQAFMGLIKEAKKAVPEREPDKGYDDLQKAINTAVQKDRFVNLTKVKELISIFSLFDKRLKPTLNRWDSKEEAKFFEAKITSEFESHIKPMIQAWKEYCHPKIIGFLKNAVATYEDLKEKRSLLNFQDLMMHTAKLLKENAEVRGYFQGKYRYLLVDEFQDTDPLQAEIMFYLTGENLAEQNWTSCRPRPGSLFVVGDPKQAIYRFRRADIDTYNRVKQLVGEHGGEVLQLTTNFRTLDSITRELNPVFAKHLPEAESVYQAAFRPLNAYKEDTGNRFSGVKRLSVSADFKKKDDIVMQDANNIALTIQMLMNQGYQAKDFMVLTRYNDGVAVYAEILENMGIPVSISGDVILGETREFQEFIILLNSFLDPTDEVSFVAVLRGIFFGISDEELYQWRERGGRFSIYAEIPEQLPLDVKNKFVLTLGKLQRCQRLIRHLAPTAAIEKIMEEIGFYPLLLKFGRNKRTYKSLMQIIESLRADEARGSTTFKKIVESFREMMSEKTTVANIEEEADAVHIMNVHKAKGLEAPIVFLAHPAKSVNPESFLSQHVKRADKKSRGYFSFAVKNGFTEKEMAVPLDWEIHKAEELKYLMEEELRIIYVAATRAERALIISTDASNKKNPWNILLEMENLEELEISPECIGTETDLPLQVITLEEYQSQTTFMCSWLERSKVQTYDHWTPTKGKNYAEVTIEREIGGGKDWGTLIHDVFEKAVQGHDLGSYLKIVLDKYGFSDDRKDEVKRYLAQFNETALWGDLQVAGAVLTEVPFTLKVEKDHSLYSLITDDKEVQHPYLVKGTIDLIYKKNDTWIIVDYKTDRAKSEEDYGKLKSFYSSQLSFYRRAWEVLTGEPVSEAYLYFLEPNQLVLL